MIFKLPASRKYPLKIFLEGPSQLCRYPACIGTGSCLPMSGYPTSLKAAAHHITQLPLQLGVPVGLRASEMQGDVWVTSQKSLQRKAACVLYLIPPSCCRNCGYNRRPGKCPRRPRPHPKECQLETRKILTPSLFDSLFLYLTHCIFGFLYMKSKQIHSGLQFFVVILFNTV